MHSQFRKRFKTRDSIKVSHFTATYFKATYSNAAYSKRMVSGFILLVLSLATSGAAAEMYSNTSVTGGFRLDSLKWNIAGDSTGSNPNVLSELSWENLNILQIGIESDISFGQKVYMRTNLSGGYIFDGEVQDSDYLGDNRTLEFSRSVNDADEGSVWDASIGVGYELWTIDSSVGRNLRIIPMLGYSFSQQNLTLTNGYQVIPATGSFPGLDSTYSADWYGPWAGVDFWFESNDENYLIVRMEYHLTDYFAEADWNLRPEFQHPVSYEHEAEGRGYVLSLAWHHTPKNAWQYGFQIDYKVWNTDEGLDRTFFNAPQVACGGSTECETQLNSVDWRSFAVAMKIRLPF